MEQKLSLKAQIPVVAMVILAMFNVALYADVSTPVTAALVILSSAGTISFTFLLPRLGIGSTAFLASNRGANIMMTIVVLAVFSFVGAIILGKLEPTMTGLKDADMSTDANTTIDAVATNTWSGYQLAILAMIILGAVVILRYAGMLG